MCSLQRWRVMQQVQLAALDKWCRRKHMRLYTRSPLEDSRLFGPSPWKFLATTYEQMDFWATQPLAKILWAGILLWRPGVWRWRWRCRVPPGCALGWVRCPLSACANIWFRTVSDSWTFVSPRLVFPWTTNTNSWGRVWQVALEKDHRSGNRGV